MEIASVLAGERWSDSPRCTHPVLAAVARLVNDAVSDTARPQLAAMVPDLVGAVGDRCTTAPDLVIGCAQTAQRYEPSARWPQRAIDRATRRLARQAGRRRYRWPIFGAVGGWAYTYGPATQTVAHTLDAIMRSAPDPDLALTELLRDCLAATVRSCPPSPESSAAPTSSSRSAGQSHGTPLDSSTVIRTHP